MTTVRGTISRRDAIRHLALFTAAAAACTPYRILTHAYPDAFDTDEQLTERVLGAFVTTIVPGVPEGDRDLTRAFADPAFPFAKYRAFFAADLCRRAKEQFGAPTFDRLDPAQRTAVIQQGLAADGTARKLYGGAVFLAQVAVYAGIYAPDTGCPLIGFPGRFRGHQPGGSKLPPPHAARELSATGNPS